MYDLQIFTQDSEELEESNLNLRINLRTSYFVNILTLSFCSINLPKAIFVNPTEVERLSSLSIRCISRSLRSLGTPY